MNTRKIKSFFLLLGPITLLFVGLFLINSKQAFAYNYCGDGEINQGEECDDGANNEIPCVPEYDKSCAYCSKDCKIIKLVGPYCGDTIKNGSEECDEKDGVPENYICDNECKLEYIYQCGQGSISGYKFNDSNTDGIWDINESAIENWTIFLDGNGNKELDFGEKSTTTLNNGSYFRFNTSSLCDEDAGM